MWEKRLSVLREEKEERRKTGFAPQKQEDRTKTAEDTSYRKRITLKQLEQKELAREEGKTGKRPGRALGELKQKEKQQNMERKHLQL